MKKYLFLFLKELFYFSFISYIIFIIIEFFKPGFVNNFLNLNIFVIIILVSGIGLVWGVKEFHYSFKYKHVGYFVVCLLGIFLLYLLKDIGIWSWLVFLATVIGGIFIFKEINN